MGSEFNSVIEAPSLDDSRPVVLVTGFGPFGNYKVNPAWLAVQALEKRSSKELPISDVKFIFRIIPVEYETVQEIMPKWWAELKPDVVIHVGVGHADCRLHIEKRASNKGYCGRDVKTRVPLENCCVKDGPCYLETEFDAERIVEDVNASLDQLDGLRPAIVSLNPGKFLCGFIYYQSLCLYSGRSIFVHVPPIDDTCVTAEKIAQGLKLVVLSILAQLQEKWRSN